MRWSIGILAVGAPLMAAGCAERYLPVDEAGRTTAIPPPAVAQPTPAQTASRPTAPNPTTPIGPPDTCGASQLQYLVGKSRLQIPVAVDLSRRRVECTTCVMSHLDDPQRTTIFFDQTTGLVTAVKCQ